MKRSLLRPRQKAPKRSNPKRKRAEFARCYGSKARVEFVKSLPCAACGVVGYSENAHVLGNGGLSRKADYTTIAPLCGPHYVGYRRVGCHTWFDDRSDDFDFCFPDFNPEKAAADCEAAWLSFSGGSPKTGNGND